MTQEEYHQQLERLKKEYELSTHKLHVSYGLSQAIFKIGDIITDTNSIIIIDKITAGKNFGDPYPVYHGFELKKDLTPKKGGSRASIYGNNNATLVK